jgi:predicted DNA-binding protein with PD1-like motif
MKFTLIFFLSLVASLLIDEPALALSSNLKVHVLRFSPGDDPKIKLEKFIQEKKIKAGIVLSAVGSLTVAQIRYANQEQTAKLSGHFEIVSLSGTLGAESGSHLHVAVADEVGKTYGGHLVDGSKVYTTLEVAIGEITDTMFTREIDPKTTYKELKVRQSP